MLVSLAEESAWYEEISLTGSVVAPRVAELSTEVRGLVAEIAVDIGDRIRPALHPAPERRHRIAVAGGGAAMTQQARHELDDARRRLAEARKLGQNQSATVTESLHGRGRIDIAELQRVEAEEKRQAARSRATA